ncbi:MAG: SHOCT domain-containing protein [Thermodesulfobacteriota bacterium]
MHPDYVWWSPMWFFPMLMPIIIIVVLALFLYLIFGRGGFRPPWRGAEGESALEILKKRYAKGEITKEEFEQMRRDIQG